MSAETKADKARESGWRETLKIFIHALILAMVVRVFFYQPFNIPSGSMKSTLLIGDYLFVSKLSYGYSRYSFPFSPNLFSGRLFSSEPERGDVIVFKWPNDNATDYIKRLVGLPGDKIQVRGGVVYINGKAVPKRFIDRFSNVECEPPGGRYCRRVNYRRYKETLPNGVSYTVLDQRPDADFDNTSVFTVPEGQYFMMGDNRDNSSDSRGGWSVPSQNLIGRADVIFFSAATDEPGGFALTRPWTWFSDIRWSRIFDRIR